jgi:DNA end-binding protein Ku
MAKKAAVAVPVQPEDRKQTVADMSAALIAEMNKNSVKVSSAVPNSDRKTSTRSTWKGLLTVGALTFSVKSYTGTEEDKIEFHGYHSASCQNRLQRGLMKCSGCGEDIAESDGVSFVEHDGVLVSMSKDEKAACQVSNDGTLKVLQFTKASEIDPMYFESTDFVAPGGDKVGDKKVAAKAFGLLRLAMIETNTIAIAKRVNKGRDQIVALRPYGLNGIVMQHLFFENEIRLFNGWENVPVEVEAPMICAAVALVNAMTEDFDPTVYGDSYLSNLRKAIATKASGADAQEFTKDAAPSGSTDDLMATLQASVAQAQAKPKRKAS